MMGEFSPSIRFSEWIESEREGNGTCADDTESFSKLTLRLLPPEYLDRKPILPILSSTSRLY
jgi:hypothetical protein